MKKGRFWAGLILGITMVLSAEFLYLLLIEEKKKVTDLIPLFYQVDNRRRQNNNFQKSTQVDSLFNTQDSLNLLARKVQVDSAFYLEMWQKIIANPAYREMDSMWIDSFIRVEYVKIKSGLRDTFYVAQEKLLERQKIDASMLVLDVKNSQDTVVRIVKDPVRNAAYLEFWQSPFNVMGYKFNPPILMLYGVEKNLVNKVFYYEDGMLLRISNQWVYVKPSSQLKSFDLPFQANWLNEIQ